jgi:alkylation response protein AidB-like acyl-CoA dehydrogenase
MINHARLTVGLQGLAIAERSYQQANDFTRCRVQGGAPGQSGRVAIIRHPDVRRMLIQMRAYLEAMYAVAYVTAAHMDVAHAASDAAYGEKALDTGESADARCEGLVH